MISVPVLPKDPSHYNEAIKEMRSVLSVLKARIHPKQFDPNAYIKTDTRIGHLEGKQIHRLVVFLRSTGCLWHQRTGGCTMCGFWAETSQGKTKITKEQFVNQFMRAIREHDMQQYPVVAIYNEGSFLQDREIPFSAAEEICYMIRKYIPNLRRLMIESRAEYVKREQLVSLKKILGQDIELTLGLGLDSQDDTVRNLCIHKGMSKAEYEDTMETVNSLGVRSIANILIKPLFLTEQEAIDEAVASTAYANKVGATEIHYESMTIEKDTLAWYFYQNGLYRLPWLWSIVEIMNRVSGFARPFLTHFVYPADHLKTPRNCDNCSPRVEDAIYQRYCSDFDLSYMKDLDCNCKNQWMEAINEVEPLPLERRVFDSLQQVKKILSK